jgi:hypothetical protein
VTLRQDFRIALTAIGILAGIVLSLAIGYSRLADRRPAPPPDLPLGLPSRARLWDTTVLPRLKATDEAAAAAAARQADAITAFFEERKRHTREFAEAVLSLRGKWNFAVAKLPWADHDRHRRFLRDKFEEILFSPDDLQRAIVSAVQGYLTCAEGLENELLVTLRQDLADSELPGGAPLLPESQEAFRREYDHMGQAVLPTLNRDLGATAGKGLANLVAGELGAAIALRVTTACATRLGVSAGILGSGAYSATVTLGAGLVAGLVIDRALDAFLRSRGYDPEGDIARSLDDTLDRLCALILDGDAGVPGLRRELEILHSTRGRVREAALRNLILERGEP